MSFENFPAGDAANQPAVQKPEKPKSDYRTILTGILLIALLGTWGYIIWDKNKVKVEKQQLTTQIVSGDSAKNELQDELNNATQRMDALKSSISKADSLISTKDKDIQDLKDKIQTILNNDKATASDLSQARALIKQLRTNIDTYTDEIVKLQNENLKLAAEKKTISEAKDLVTKNFDSARDVIKQKEDIIDVGSTLHASNFEIVGIKERGNKEKATTTAKRVDKLRITFDLDENRITQSGNKDIFVCITAPDGTPIAVEALGSGKFVTRDGVEKLFSKKVQVNYTQGQKQTVTVEWQQNSAFQTGDYKIEVYNNGFKIGEGVRNFKKGGLFS